MFKNIIYISIFSGIMISSMGLNFKLIQRTAKTSTSDVMHSSGYAKVQNNGAFGASDNTSFAERQRIEQHRKHIRGYNNAKVARGVGMMPKAQSVEDQAAIAAAAAAIAEAKNAAANSSGRQEFNVTREQGGLQKYDSRSTGSINRTAKMGFGGGAAQSAASQRAAMAARFSGGNAHPIPKTGGFGRH
jgi:hypothetical protein